MQIFIGRFVLGSFIAINMYAQAMEQTKQAEDKTDVTKQVVLFFSSREEGEKAMNSKEHSSKSIKELFHQLGYNAVIINQLRYQINLTNETPTEVSGGPQPTVSSQVQAPQPLSVIKEITAPSIESQNSVNQPSVQDEAPTNPSTPVISDVSSKEKPIKIIAFAFPHKNDGDALVSSAFKNELRMRTGCTTEIIVDKTVRESFYDQTNQKVIIPARFIEARIWTGDLNSSGDEETRLEIICGTWTDNKQYTDDVKGLGWWFGHSKGKMCLVYGNNTQENVTPHVTALEARLKLFGYKTLDR